LIRVGFVLNFAGQTWLGGVSYFRNLFSALRQLPDRRIEPVIVTGRNVEAASLADFAPAELLRTALVDVGTPGWKLRRAFQLYASRDWLFERFLRRHRIALLSHSGYLGRRCPLPALCWIPDFQEMHLPEFFSENERAGRRRNVAEACKHATAILVSSHTAEADLRTLMHQCARKAHVLHFVAGVPPLEAVPSRAELQQRYGFDRPFFHLPNQFWVHKNHKLVLEALRLLKEQRREILVVATGNTDDHRQPDSFAHLMRTATEVGVLDGFRVLGVVPYRDLMGLMAASIAVVNPSLFEGWSTTVEEAKSFGKQVVLSDIPVHREQAPERAFYFDPHSAAALAECLWNASRQDHPDVDAVQLRSSARLLAARQQQFARTFERIVLGLTGEAAS
jgi:glycosyltransferase involved in cell wall biosynthesis